MATILIVDDEPVILDVFRRFLEADGRTLVLAGSAREAIARAEEPGELDVALVDKNLGDGSGLDVARALRRAKPDVEVILVTGYASLDTAIQAMQIGAFDYVTKPISDYEALNLKVENAAEKVRMKRRQRELVAQLVESEAVHRGVFETSSDAMLLVDAATNRLEDANPAAERLYGRARDALRELRLEDLADPEAGPPLPSAGTRALPGGTAARTTRCSRSRCPSARCSCAGGSSGSCRCATSRSASPRRPPAASSSRTSARRRRWRPSGGSPAGSRTTSRTCSP